MADREGEVRPGGRNQREQRKGRTQGWGVPPGGFSESRQESQVVLSQLDKP